jgi:hypothetical protein
MARRDPTDDRDYPLDEWEIAAEDDRPVELLGFAGEESETGGAFVYDAAMESVYEAETNTEEGEVVLDESSARSLDTEEELGEVIEDIGERLGWEGLSEFAREHLEDDES